MEKTKKEAKITKNITAGLAIAAMFLVSFIFYNYLPEQVPLHWKGIPFTSTPDVLTTKGKAVFIFPFVGILTSVVYFWLIGKRENRKKEYENKNVIAQIFLLVIQILLYSLTIRNI